MAGPLKRLLTGLGALSETAAMVRCSEILPLCPRHEQSPVLTHSVTNSATVLNYP